MRQCGNPAAPNKGKDTIMAIKKEKNKHLTDDLRLELEAALHKRKSFSQIKRELGIPRSTIKREITNHRVESTKVFFLRPQVQSVRPPHRLQGDGDVRKA